MNQPYVKVYKDGKLLNPITKEKPFINKFKSARGKSGPVYVNLNHPLTGKWMGKYKVGGNNRKWNNGKPRMLN